MCIRSAIRVRSKHNDGSLRSMKYLFALHFARVLNKYERAQVHGFHGSRCAEFGCVRCAQ
jgi:hypothetical protein